MVYNRGKYFVVIHKLTTCVGFYPVVLDDKLEIVFVELASESEDEAVKDANDWIDQQEPHANAALPPSVGVWRIVAEERNVRQA